MIRREFRFFVASVVTMVFFIDAVQKFTHARILVPGIGIITATLAVGFLARLVPGIRRFGWLTWLLSAICGVVLIAAQLPGAPASVWDSALGTFKESHMPLDGDPDTTWVFLAGLVVVCLLIEFFAQGLRLPGLAVLPVTASYMLISMMPGRVMNPIRFAGVFAGFLLILAADTTNRTIRWRRALTKDTGRGNDVLYTVGRLGAIMGTAVIAVALAIGTFMPILPSTNVFNTDGAVRTEDPRLELDRSLKLPEPRVVITYVTDKPGPLYLRRTALATMDEKGWQNNSFQSFRATGTEFELPSAPGVKVATTTRNTQVKVIESQQEYLPIPYSPAVVHATGQWSYDPETMGILRSDFHNDQGISGVSFAVRSEEVLPTLEQARNAKVGTIDAKYTFVPDEVPVEIKWLSKEITTGAVTPMEKATAIQNYLRSDIFTYNLDIPAPESGGNYTGLSDFLLRTKTGYCSHFAAGMATMARMQGIPSRIAIGWNGGKQVAPGSWEVSNIHAHAWTELYFEDYGWLRFEPTPGSISGPPPPYTVVKEEPKPEPTRTPTPTPTTQPSTSVTAAPTTSAAPPPAAAPQHQLDLRWLLVPLGLAVVVFFCYLPRLVRASRRSRALAMTGLPDEQVLAAWGEIRDTMIDLHAPWPKDSPRAIAESLRRSLGTHEFAQLLDLALAVERVRFGRSFDEAPDELAAMTRAITSSLLQLAPQRARRRALWLPRSNWTALRYRLSRAGRAEHTIRPRRRA